MGGVRHRSMGIGYNGWILLRENVLCPKISLCVAVLLWWEPEKFDPKQWYPMAPFISFLAWSHTALHSTVGSYVDPIVSSSNSMLSIALHSPYYQKQPYHDMIEGFLEHPKRTSLSGNCRQPRGKSCHLVMSVSVFHSLGRWKSKGSKESPSLRCVGCHKFMIDELQKAKTDRSRKLLTLFPRASSLTYVKQLINSNAMLTHPQMADISKLRHKRSNKSWRITELPHYKVWRP